MAETSAGTVDEKVVIIFILLKVTLLFRQERPLFEVRFLQISQRVLYRNLIRARYGMHEQVIEN